MIKGLVIKKSQFSDSDDLVSIIIPCYNQAEYLEEAVESAINQTYANIEIIIVNDGSPDNTAEVAADMQKKYPHCIYILTQENQGLSQARNNGIEMSSGAYILPLDSDDRLHKDMIAHCMQTMKKENADIVYVDVQCYGFANNLALKKPFSENNILYENLPPPISLYRKLVWETTGGYKKNMNIGYEDWEFWINAYKHNFKFQYHPETLLYYCVKEESMVTEAYAQDVYLQAKIVMNHPELYTLYRVENAMSIIKEREDLADLYFSYAKETIIDETVLLSALSHYLEAHTLKEKQIINISPDKQIGLYTLDVLESTDDLEYLMHESGTNLLVFYSAMRYEMPLFKNCTLSWKKTTGSETAYGTVFPFTSKRKREDVDLQALAHKREDQYQAHLLSREENIKRNKLISVVIPCYNQGQYLQETVESVVAQTYQNIEIIIVNDGSTDESAGIAQKLSEYYPDKNIRLVNQENKGLSEARNRGIQEASGDYLFLLDADDKIDIDKKILRHCMNAMVEQHADIVYGDYQYFGEKSTIQKTRAKVELYFIQYINITGATALYKREVWEKTGGYKHNMDGGYEDWELWVNATKKGFKFHHIPQIVFSYRVKKESMYTDAVTKHDYLCSKVVMNHPELYTESQQEEAIESIREFENAPDFFFYFDRHILTDEKKFMLQIEEYLTKNNMYEKLQSETTCIITALGSFGTIALCNLHSIKGAEQLREAAMNSNADHIVFYSKLKHSTDHLNIGTVESSRFACSKEKGCVPAKGMIFPLLDSNEHLKREAYQRSERYFTERCKTLETRLQNNKYLDENNIDNIRDAALVLENTDIELAYDLMSIAYDARPDGPRIIKKLSEYRYLLNINDDSPTQDLKAGVN